MNSTENYQLNQWETTDRVLMDDFNADNAKIESALSENADAIAANTAAHAGFGNCEIEVLTYTGTGDYSSTSTEIAFTQQPDLFFIGGDQAVMTGRGGDSAAQLMAKSTTASSSFVNDVSVSWSGTQLSLNNSISARYQMNTQNVVYWVVGLRKKA